MSGRPVIVEIGEVLGRAAGVANGAWKWSASLRETAWVAPADVYALETTTIVSDDVAADRIGREVCILMCVHGGAVVTTLSPAAVAALLNGGG
jgi:hypothetical protein